MLSPELISQVRSIQLRAGHLASDLLAGEYTSSFKGRGMQFDEVREYVPGDEVRTIDWNVTARTGTPHIKIYREERELTMLLMVDTSPSQRFGGGTRTKQTAAAELAAVLAWLAIRSQDRVGLLLYSDHVEHFVPPGKGRGHVWHIIRSVLTHKSSGRETRSAVALEYALKHLRRRSLCFLISDFLTPDFEDKLKLASRRHDLVCVRTVAPLEETLPDAGIVLLEDSETGETFEIDSSDAGLRQRFASRSAQRKKELEALVRRAGADMFHLRPSESVAKPLLEFLRKPKRARR